MIQLSEMQYRRWICLQLYGYSRILYRSILRGEYPDVVKISSNEYSGVYVDLPHSVWHLKTSDVICEKPGTIDIVIPDTITFNTKCEFDDECVECINMPIVVLSKSILMQQYELLWQWSTGRIFQLPDNVGEVFAPYDASQLSFDMNTISCVYFLRHCLDFIDMPLDMTVQSVAYQLERVGIRINASGKINSRVKLYMKNERAYLLYETVGCTPKYKSNSGWPIAKYPGAIINEQNIMGATRNPHNPDRSWYHVLSYSIPGPCMC